MNRLSRAFAIFCLFVLAAYVGCLVMRPVQEPPEFAYLEFY